MSDLHKFVFEGLPVRGALVRLTDSWGELLRRRQASGPTPAPVQALLGQMAAAATLMQASIKFNGALLLQLHGDGPVRLAVAEAQPDLSFRATATVLGAVPDDARLEAMLNVHGAGRCAITLDPRARLPGQQPYQGIVPLQGDRGEALQEMSRVLEHYMRQSEQVDTRLVLAADARVAAGLLVQRMPGRGASPWAGAPGGSGPSGPQAPLGRDEDFNRIALLAGTLTRDELLGLEADALLRRLFHHEDVRRFEPLRPRFACPCSRERVGGMLAGLGRREVDAIVAEQGRVEVGCEFCGLKYEFDRVDAASLFTPAADHPPASRTLN